MSWSRAVWVGAALAAIAVACSSFDEPPTSPTASDGGGADGGSEPDGSNAVPDANGATDAIADADAGGCKAPTPSNCANGIVQQLDFTSGALPPGTFTQFVDEGTFSHLPNEGFCAPGALHASTTVPNDASASSEATLNKAHNGSFKTAQIAFAFRGPKPAAGGYANVGCIIVFRPAATTNLRSSVRMTLDGDELSYGGTVRDADGGIAADAAAGKVNLDGLVSAAEAAEWHTLEARFVIASTKVTASVTYDGTAKPDFDVALLEPVGRIGIECGIPFSNGAGTSYSMDLDDLFVELCPQ